MKDLNKKNIKQRERIIYSLNVEDIQTVANDELNRDLTDEEIKLVENEVGDYINWYDAICFAIHDVSQKFK